MAIGRKLLAGTEYVVEFSSYGEINPPYIRGKTLPVILRIFNDNGSVRVDIELKDGKVPLSGPAKLNALYQCEIDFQSLSV